jgi:HD-GYP domain-containing protein (c-di-GMP phosphodiesterase class II)
MMKENLIIIKKMLKAKSMELHNHSEKTALILETLVKTAGLRNYSIPVTPEEATTLGLLHDIGKVYINDVIFNKQESLSEREWETIKLHPTWGKQFVQGTVFEKYGQFIIQHHEKSDGTGYPNKLKDESIYALSHLLNVSDQLASLIENRPYNRGIEDKNTLLSILTPNIKQIFGLKTQCILSETIDCIFETKDVLPLHIESENEIPENFDFNFALSL